MKPLVSVIVPVYKVEPYLERCLDSLADQTLKEIEIIVIDDGSPDRCGEICDAYAAKDARFRVVHQENRGLSAARNAGIELARADYLMFVDSDDWVEPEFCRLPYEAAVEHGAELVIFQYEKVNDKQHLVFPQNMEEGIKSKDIAMWMLYHGANVAVWNKLYAKKLCSEVRFIDGRYCEDHPFQVRIIYHADSVFFLHRMLYNYSTREGSITRLRNEKFVQDRYDMQMEASRYLEARGYHEEGQYEKVNACFVYLIAEGRSGQHSADCLTFLKSLKCNPDQFSWRRKAMIRLLSFSPRLFDLVCILRGKRIR